MDVIDAIKERRTHKAYRPEPVPREVLDELFDLARWAPNHNLTNPWRFRPVGPRTLERMKGLLDEVGAAKLDRAPTLVVASYARNPDDEVADEEDKLATAAAIYIVLLAAHARGLVGYWRTPAFLRDREGQAAVGIGEDERALGLLYLGYPIQERKPPERAPLTDTVIYTE